MNQKRPALKAFRVAHFPKALKKSICLFGFAKWYKGHLRQLALVVLERISSEAR
ncbi:MAG: hypothetical protein ACI9FG_001229, partial [Crocinitomicaceae bacterium]